MANHWNKFRANEYNTGTTIENIIIEAPQVYWEYRIDRGIFVSSPAIFENTLVIGCSDGYLYSIRVSDGQLQWRYRTGKTIHSSPAIDSSGVYFNSYDDDFYALDLNGRLKWRYWVGGTPSSPLIYRNNVFSSSMGELVAMDLQTGVVAWRCPASVVLGCPVIYDNTIFFGENTGGQGSFCAFDLATNKENWRYTTNMAIVSSPAIINNTVVCADRSSVVFALNVSTGNTIWECPLLLGIESSPSVTPELVYVGSNDSNLYAISTLNGRVQWSFKTGHRIEGSPAVSGGIVYITSTDGFVYALDRMNGNLKWKFQTNNPIQSSPVLANNLLFVASNDGNIYAIKQA